MNTCAICLFNESNMLMLIAVNLSIIKLMTEALLSKTEEDSVSFFRLSVKSDQVEKKCI